MQRLVCLLRTAVQAGGNLAQSALVSWLLQIDLSTEVHVTVEFNHVKDQVHVVLHYAGNLLPTDLSTSFGCSGFDAGQVHHLQHLDDVVDDQLLLNVNLVFSVGQAVSFTF